MKLYKTELQYINFNETFEKYYNEHNSIDDAFKFLLKETKDREYNKANILNNKNEIILSLRIIK